ncbi:MAG: prolyl oligopeptidase family serine peptidase [Alphaproteobacteria bacterium]|nr:prolyl oligopeptidase family serine peptidase [Alphaproteobacteria bacterium]
MRRSVLCMLAGLAIASTAPAVAQEKPLLSVADIHKLKDISDPVISPDGRYVAYVVSGHNLKSDETVSDIWRVPFAGGKEENLTKSKDASESEPRYSRDGKWLAFLSDKGKDADVQVWMMKAKGGHARRVTRIKGGVSDFAISPDGTKILLTAEVGKTVGDKSDTQPPIVITRFQFKQDVRGYLDDRRLQLFLVDVKSGETQQLTSGDFDCWFPDFSPDGRLVSFVSNRRPEGQRGFDYDVWVMKPEKGAAPRRLGADEGDDSDPDWGMPPQWSPDSKQIVWLAAGDDKWIYYAPFQMVVGDVATSATRRVANIDRWFYHPRWSSDGKSLYALIEQDRATWLARIDPETDKIDYLTSGERFGYDFAVGPKDEIAVLDGDPEHPYALRALGANPLALTHQNDWLDAYRLGETRGVSARSDGIDINGLLVLPPDYKPGTAYPMIVRVHGGPVYQFSWEFMFDWQVYAANGFVVLGPNPRGSSGRGFDFARAIYADWGDLDVKDAHALVDKVVEEGIADKTRLGVGGWSYGGILTDYLVASDTRFKAGISGAGMGDFIAGYGDDQYAREYELELGTPWRDLDTYLKISYPFFHADRIKTPTMFQCGTADFNVPCIGAEQMYQALKSLDVPARLIIYPGENHGLTTPSYIEDRLQRDLDWYNEYLKK